MRTALTALITLSCLLLQPAYSEDGKSEDGKSEDGKAVFEEACASCHDSLIGGWMSGAPGIGDTDYWQPILPKGIDALTFATIEGYGEMPPRGKCDTCSDAQIRAAVEYMVEVIGN